MEIASAVAGRRHLARRVGGTGPLRVYQVTGDIEAAREAWRQALDILDGLNDPQLARTAAAVRAKLRGGPTR